MSEMKKGESVDILAPLGNGFKIEKGKRYCLIGGGIGVPPMLYTAKQCENPLVITGFRNKTLSFTGRFQESRCRACADNR